MLQEQGLLPNKSLWAKNGNYVLGFPSVSTKLTHCVFLKKCLSSWRKARFVVLRAKAKPAKWSFAKLSCFLSSPIVRTQKKEGESLSRELWPTILFRLKIVVRVGICSHKNGTLPNTQLRRRRRFFKKSLPCVARKKLCVVL